MCFFSQDYNGKGVGVNGSVAMNVDIPLDNKENGIVQSNKQATNDKGEKIYIDPQGNETLEAKIKYSPGDFGDSLVESFC